MKKIKISPSLMCSDFLEIKKDLDVFEANKIDFLHIDIMDGHYVPNFTLGVDFCKAVSSYSDIPLDIHLMIENVDAYIPSFSFSKSTILSIHPEVSYHPLRSIQLIKDNGLKAGIAVDPSVSLEEVKYLLPDLDMVCIMTVNPGYSGQKLIPQSIQKIKEFSQYLESIGSNIDIEVDGNVSWDNIPKMVDAGADILVAGTSSIFTNDGNLAGNIRKLNKLLAELSAKR
jgi:ribulose-phosphate 3-epimerase